MIALGVRLSDAPSEHDVRAVEDAVRKASAHSDARAYGIMALARRHVRRGDLGAAVAVAEASSWPRSPEVADELEMVRADLLVRCTRSREALALLARVMGRHTDDPDLNLRAAGARLDLEQRVDHGSGPVVEALNAVYRNAGFAMLWRTCVSTPSGIGNLSCESPVAEPTETLPMVTVATWADANGEVPALASLCNQSWTNLEIVLLAGADLNDQVRRRIAVDRRIMLLDVDPMTVDPLMAAIEQGSGHLIALQPPTGWVHPQRIEAQASALTANSGWQGNIVSHLRVGDELRPHSLGDAIGLPLIGPEAELTMLRRREGDAGGMVGDFRSIRENRQTATGELHVPDRFAVIHARVPLVLTATNGQQGRH